MQTLLLTGANGFIGQHLQNALKVSNDYHVIEASLSKWMSNTTYAEQISRLLSSASEFSTTISLSSLYVTEHSPKDISSLIQYNIQNQTLLLEYLVSSTCRNVIFAGTPWQTFSDNDPASANLYAATKKAFLEIARFYASAYDFRILNLQIPDTYGPNDSRPKILPNLKTSLLQNSRPTQVDLTSGQQIVDFLHIEDICAGFISAAKLAATLHTGVSEFALRSENPLTLRQLLEIATKNQPKPYHLNWSAKPHRSREIMSPVTNTPLLPGWSPQVSLEHGLKSYFAETNL